jgi:hypothetical protein
VSGSLRDACSIRFQYASFLLIPIVSHVAEIKMVNIGWGAKLKRKNSASNVAIRAGIPIVFNKINSPGRGQSLPGQLMFYKGLIRIVSTFLCTSGLMRGQKVMRLWCDSGKAGLSFRCVK